MFETTRNILLVIGCIGLIGTFMFGGCTGQQQHALQATGAMPGAGGKVTLSKDDLSETIVEIDAQNLVARDKNQAKAYYVAWTQFEDDSIKLGTLKVVGGNGKLTSKTKLNRFKVIVTSEDFPSVKKPVDGAILKTKTLLF